jgi:hypothetical protein
MTQAAAVTDPLMQLLAECREQPLVYDAVGTELCTSLEQIILGRMQNRGRKTGSLNVGGWKSGEDFFTWPDAAVQAFRQVIVEMVGARRSLVAWAMVNRSGSHHPRHQHRIALLSGVYYVAPGNVRTPTVFECPCDGRPMQSELEVDPHPGRLVICRGETWHRVPVYAGDLPRITIAFDVRR